jgi:hypothetical protein
MRLSSQYRLPLMIGYTTCPYTANTFIGRLTYLW